MSTPSTPRSRPAILRHLKWILPLVLLAGLIALAFRPRTVDVDIGTVTSGPMLLSVDEDGMTRIRERYVISAPLAGRLGRVELDPGDRLKAGSVIATLDPGEPNLLDPRLRAQAEARMKAAEASLARANSQLEAAQVDSEMRAKAYERIRHLASTGNVAEVRLEEAECLHLGAQLNIRAAESAVKVATFDLEQARAALLHTTSENENGAREGQNFTIRSPIDGLVFRVFEESSTVVTAGSRLMEIGDPKDLELIIDVLSQDAVNIRSGQRVILDYWGGEHPLNARVRHVEPSAFTKVSALGVDEQRVNVIADLEDRPGPGETLGDSFRIEARIVTWETAGALRVPAGALFRTGDQWSVYRLVGGRAVLTAVEIDHHNGSEAEVLAGLADGDQVVLHPGDRIADGTPVAARE